MIQRLVALVAAALATGCALPEATESIAGASAGAGGASDGLLVRYFLDEAASGVSPTQAFDSAPDPGGGEAPLHLTLTDSPEMSYVEVDGHRGLRWTAIEGQGRAGATIDDTKLKRRLHGSKQATIELVVELDHAAATYSRIIDVGESDEGGQFTLSCPTDSTLAFRTDNGVDRAVWPVEFVALDRAVLHVVLDTTQAAEGDRVRLYVNGGFFEPDSVAMPLDYTFDLGVGKELTLGNRSIGDRSFEGVLFYVAIYERALSPEEVGSRAGTLVAADDEP